MTANEHAAGQLYQDLVAVLRKARREIHGERECLYDGATDGEGNYSDPEDERAVQELDTLLDEMDAVLLRCARTPWRPRHAAPPEIPMDNGADQAPA